MSCTAVTPQNEMCLDQLIHVNQLMVVTILKKQCFVAENLLYQVVCLCSLWLLSFPREWIGGITSGETYIALKLALLGGFFQYQVLRNTVQHSLIQEHEQRAKLILQRYLQQCKAWNRSGNSIKLESVQCGMFPLADEEVLRCAPGKK